jgi:hypothetical protein
VAEVKGAILTVFPAVRLVDVTHEIPPGDVRTGAFLLERATRAFPAGTTFLAVVYPGVGTSRRALACQAGSHMLVGPDNGLLGRAAGAGARWFRLDREDLFRRPVSLTFHGRDVFGPVAAALAAARVTPAGCGAELADPVALPPPRRFLEARRAGTEVLAVDRFGNLVLGLEASALAPRADGSMLTVRAGGGPALPAAWGTYLAGDAAPLVVHEDGSGCLEVAVPRGSAAALLAASTGTPVDLEWSS